MTINENAQQALQRQKLLLQMEYYAEKEAFRKQTEVVGMQRKVKRGDAWFPLRVGKNYYNSLNQRVVEVYREQDLDIEHNFEFGKPVVFFRQTTEGKLHFFSFTGTVSYADGERMVVVVPDSAPLLDLQSDGGQKIGCQLSFDETSYREMLDALDRVISAKGNRLAYLRDLFYGPQPAQTYGFGPVRLPWLNGAQEQAVSEVVRAQSNMAVDWISEKLVDRGISVLRIGNPSRVNDKMLGFTYERRFEAHPDYPQLWAIRKAIRELRAQRRRGGSENYHQKLERLKSRATELELRINSELFNEARVIASTLVGSNNRLMQGQKFNTLFIDEAAQALEAACWIAIRRASRVILAGDHCQLPPTVKSMAALKGGLGKTLMERIVERKPAVVTLLKVQYRMNEEIMRFSSDWFYHGEVVGAPQVSHRGILDYDIPIDWIAVEGEAGEGGEEFVGNSFGRVNKREAELTLDVLRRYFVKIGKRRVLDEQIDVGVISPYRAQVQYLRALIKKDAFFKPFRHLLSVNTVDGFQGQERDVILISLVRSNAEGQIGFLRDLRRMNVAITRARMKLMILGDPATLCRHPFYKRLYDYVRSLGGTEAADPEATP